MKKNSDFAKLLLRKARQDALVVEKLSSNPEIEDDVIGFHFQQVIEKSLKAILVAKNVKIRRTHDIRELLDLIKDNKISLPQWFETLDSWTPYAVDFRYDDLPQDRGSGISRTEISPLAYAIIQHVEGECSREQE
jgi:HEPN domain-containing protein